jgi:hypothetical protein
MLLFDSCLQTVIPVLTSSAIMPELWDREKIRPVLSQNSNGFIFKLRIGA